MDDIGLGWSVRLFRIAGCGFWVLGNWKGRARIKAQVDRLNKKVSRLSLTNHASRFFTWRRDQQNKVPAFKPEIQTLMF